jgi:glycosyltransferase involved in cell wall biosynthesis
VRILHVINTLDPVFGGPVEAVRQFAADGDDNSVEVLCLDNEAPQPALTVPTHVLPGAMTKYRYSPALGRWLRSNAERFDAVIVHGIWHYHAVGTWLGLRGSGVPYFVILHGMLNPWFKRTYPLKHLKKALFWHTLVHPALKSAAAVLFLCEDERDLAHHTFALRPKRIAIAPLGIRKPPPSFSANEAWSALPMLRGKRVILFLGRICYMKGCDLLLEAFAEICKLDPQLHLLVCGPDHEGWQPDLIGMAECLGIADRVTWAGPLYGEQKWEALRNAELFVLPSHCETFPIAVLEALACSTPVVITSRVGIHREIHRAHAGLVCEDNTKSLASALRTWLDLDTYERDTYRQSAAEAFRTQFELRICRARHSELIHNFSQLCASQSASAHLARSSAAE